MGKTYSTNQWAQRVKERDGKRCQHEGCGETLHLEAHHIIPVSQGGLNTLENGVTLCREHHIAENVQVHGSSRRQSRSKRLFTGNRSSKREAAYRFLSKKRLMEAARPRGPWRFDSED